MLVFVRTLVYEVRTAAQFVADATTRAGAYASPRVGAGVEAAAAAVSARAQSVRDSSDRVWFAMINFLT